MYVAKNSTKRKFEDEIEGVPLFTAESTKRCRRFTAFLVPIPESDGTDEAMARMPENFKEEIKGIPLISNVIDDDVQSGR